MEMTSKWVAGGWLMAMSAPAWAKGPPGIEPTLFVMGVAAAFAVGAAVGYAVGKASGSESKDQ